jgi:hypothetical protein
MLLSPSTSHDDRGQAKGAIALRPSSFSRSRSLPVSSVALIGAEELPRDLPMEDVGFLAGQEGDDHLGRLGMGDRFSDPHQDNIIEGEDHPGLGDVIP